MPPRSAAADPTLPPERRKLRIYASDPLAGRRASQRITIDIENEPGLEPGPTGQIVQVVDYDGRRDCYYAPVHLDHPALLMQNGIEPNEIQPQFHQQMVYAVSMKVIETAQRALGRPITFHRPGRPRLRLMPHAFVGANAFFDPKLNAILFGYFRASTSSPGANLPGQPVFTCLSHDVIAHEVTHAIVHRLRPHFMEPTNADVLAFHEAFADIVALLQRFTYREVLIEQLQEAGGRVEMSSLLIDLAQQFGEATGCGTALRSGLGVADPHAMARECEPHARGAILVAAVFGGFLRVAGQRARTLFRIASNGTGVRPQGRLPGDLLGRLAADTAQAADRVLRMCFRAFDYLPPVDVTFGDFLRALVTADCELDPEDADDRRFAMIEEFRLRGIYPDGVASLAESALLLQACHGRSEYRIPPLPETFREDGFRLLALTSRALARVPRNRGAERHQAERSEALRDYQNAVYEPGEAGKAVGSALQRKIARGLHAYARANACALRLHPDRTIAVSGFHPVMRIGADQRLVVELVAQFVQSLVDPRTKAQAQRLRGGTTVIFSADLRPRYLIAKPTVGREARERREAFVAWLDEVWLSDPRTAWNVRDPFAARSSLRRMHGG